MRIGRQGNTARLAQKKRSCFPSHQRLSRCAIGEDIVDLDVGACRMLADIVEAHPIARRTASVGHAVAGRIGELLELFERRKGVRQ